MIRNLDLQFQLQHMIDMWDYWSQLFEIKFHKWNQLVESILHIKDVNYLLPHYNFEDFSYQL